MEKFWKISLNTDGRFWTALFTEAGELRYLYHNLVFDPRPFDHSSHIAQKMVKMFNRGVLNEVTTLEHEQTLLAS